MVHNGAMADAIPSRPAPPPLDDSCALFLDVDGTLVDFDTDPDAVRLRPQLRGAIGTISDRLVWTPAPSHNITRARSDSGRRLASSAVSLRYLKSFLV